MTIEELLGLGPVLPVATIGSLDDAVPLARALLAGGVRALEVTLRTSAALAAIQYITEDVPELHVGAGTVLAPRQVEAAERAGASFLVTPGTTPPLLERLTASPLPILPGCSTASEVAFLLEHGVRTMKLFPAEASGGRDLLEAFVAPFPTARFCPTGGIEPSNAGSYLGLPNVLAVGGSWITQRQPGAIGWDEVTAAARAASRH